MKTIAVDNYKGGVGKTTTVINLAYNLSAKGKRVLMVDTDPQANATYIYSKGNESTRTLLDIFHGKKTISCIYRTKYPNLDLIKGSPRMEEADGLPLIIKEALKQVEDRYDYAIIDCHPSMQLPTIAALVAADELLIPYEPDVFGKTGLTSFPITLHRSRKSITQVLHIMFSSQNMRNANRSLKKFMI